MKKILLIEDDPFLVDIYATKLKETGFNVEVATDGEQGWKKLVEKKFDLLILDIVLPQIDGWKILEKIQDSRLKIKDLEDLQVVILSNLSQKEEVEKGMERGAAKYLIKAHYTPSEVIGEIKKILK